MPHTEFGEGTIATLSGHVSANGSRAFVVTDPGVRDAGVLARATDVLTEADIEWTVFDQVDPNPTDRNVAAGVAALTEFGIEDTVMVLVGGGSAMDCGKYVALAAPSGIDDLSLAFTPELGDDDRIDMSTLAPAKNVSGPTVTTIAVPTTSGTASETNGGGLITRESDHRKLGFSGATALPEVIILDPSLVTGLPPQATAACGMDVLAHAIEAYTSVKANPHADVQALEAIRLTGAWLPAAVEDGMNMEARSAMHLASHLAGRAFSSGPLLGLVHATGHPISATFGIAHGQTLATMLPPVMAFNSDVVADRYASVGAALGTEADPDAAIAAVQKLSAAVGTDKSLTDLGATESDIDDLTTDALRDFIILTTPRMPSRSEVSDLYQQAL